MLRGRCVLAAEHSSANATQKGLPQPFHGPSTPFQGRAGHNHVWAFPALHKQAVACRESGHRSLGPRPGLPDVHRQCPTAIEKATGA